MPNDHWGHMGLITGKDVGILVNSVSLEILQEYRQPNFISKFEKIIRTPQKIDMIEDQPIESLVQDVNTHPFDLSSIILSK